MPVVVHHSDRGWTCGTDLRDLIDIPHGLHDVLSPLLPNFPFILDDLAAHSSESLRERAMTEMGKLALTASSGRGTAATCWAS